MRKFESVSNSSVIYKATIMKKNCLETDIKTLNWKIKWLEFSESVKFYSLCLTRLIISRLKNFWLNIRLTNRNRNRIIQGYIVPCVSFYIKKISKNNKDAINSSIVLNLFGY